MGTQAPAADAPPGAVRAPTGGAGLAMSDGSPYCPRGMTRPPRPGQATRGARPTGRAPAPNPEAAPRAPADGLGAALWQLRRRSGQKRRYVRRPIALGALDPWAAFLRAERRPPHALWAEAKGALCWAAGGPAARVPADLSPRRRGLARRLVAACVPLPGAAQLAWDAVPTVVGAWPFFDAAARLPRGRAASPGGSARPPWPAGGLFAWLPQTLYVRIGATCWLVQSAELPRTRRGCVALARRLEAHGRAVQAKLGANAPAEAPARAQQVATTQVNAGAGVKPRLAVATSAGRDGEAQAAFAARVEATLARIARGAVTKVVLARFAVLRPGQRGPGRARFAPVATAHRLRAAHPDAKTFLFACGRGQAFVGATPELLLQAEGGRLVSQALAGTRRRGRTPKADATAAAQLLASAKDRHEHAAVVAGLRRALAACGLRTPRPPAPVARATGQLWHLHAPIAAKLPAGTCALALVAALHPSPAVGGTPTATALRQLCVQEPWRGAYAGPVGWLTASGAHFAVGIRSLLVGPRAAYAFAGAGIVAGSAPAAEWRETCAKLKTASSGLCLVTG